MIEFLCAIGGATVTALGAILLYLIKRKDEKCDKEDVQTKALRYIMLYIIQERSKTLLLQDKVSLEDKRSLRHWHDLYHNGLGGNGDADLLMKQIDAKPIDFDA